MDNSNIQEAREKTAVVSWGRMNPITSGHEKLVAKLKKEARGPDHVPMLFLSHSHDKKKNPLTYDQKIDLATKAFGRIVQKSSARTVFQVMEELTREGYDNVKLVVGSDRVREFHDILNKYNGIELRGGGKYEFKNIEIISAGERDPDADGVSGMSASKMRAAAAAGEVDKFISGLPKKLQPQGKRVFNMVRNGMGLSEGVGCSSDNIFADECLDERVLSRVERMKIGRTMRKNKSKILAARKRAMRKKPTKEVYERRAKRRAIAQVRDKVSGNKKYSQMSAGERQVIDRKVRSRDEMVKRIARKLVPQMRREEVDYIEESNKTFDDFLTETPTKRHHQARNKDGSIKLDRRFRAFKKRPALIIKQNGEIDLEVMEIAKRVIEAYKQKDFQPNLEERANQHAMNRGSFLAGEGGIKLDEEIPTVDWLFDVLMEISTPKERMWDHIFDEIDKKIAAGKEFHQAVAEIDREVNSGKTTREIQRAYIAKKQRPDQESLPASQQKNQEISVGSGVGKLYNKPPKKP